MTRQYSYLVRCRQYLEAKLFSGFIYLTKHLSLETSSALCGKIAELIAKFLPRTNKIARHNLAVAFAERSTTERNLLLKQTWNNVGRFVGEFYQIYKCIDDATFLQMVHMDAESKKNFAYLVETAHQRGVIVVSAHLGNWEVGVRFMHLHQVPLHMIYRRVNNIRIQEKIVNIRSGYSMLEKGRAGAKEIIHILNQHDTLITMMDQHLTAGINVPFFGEPAKTADAMARLAISYQLPIVPFYMARQLDSHGKLGFIGIVQAPILPTVTRTSSVETQTAAIYSILSTINNGMESVIRQYPDQWFWLHNRWKITA